MLNQVPSDRQSLFESCPQPMWVLSADDFRILKLNSASTRAYGYSAEEFLQLSFKEICTSCALPPWMEPSVEPVSQNLRAETKIEARLQFKNGRWADVEIFIAPIFHEDNRAYLCVIIDVTEKKRTENALRLLSQAGAVLSESFDSETILKTTALLALESLADICIIDSYDEQSKAESSFTRLLCMHRILEMDKQASELKTYSPAPKAGDFVFDTIAAHRARLLDEINAAIDPHSPRNGSYLEILNKLQCHSAIAAPLESHDRVFGAMTLIRTGARDSFRADDLWLVEEFTRRAALAIENAKLYNQAQKANESKTQFLTHMSHEMRTPLTAIVGFTDILLERENDPAEQRRYFEVIRRNGQQLSDLIGDLLDLAKIEAGKIDLNLKEMSPVELIEDVLSLLALKANEKGLKIEIDIARDVPQMIRSDHLRLKQILINILNNAIKFSQNGTINVRETVIVRDGKKLIGMEVTDHGIGITPENQSKLFQPFTQADSTMSRRFGGSGIGLSLSRKLARALGGDVEIVSSNTKDGSTFLITFPLLEVAAHESMPQASPAPQRDSSEQLQQAVADDCAKIIHPQRSEKQRQCRILLVEDSIDNQLMIKTLLKGDSFEIDFANDGVQAIRKGTSKPYDLILMDIQMPVMDGYAATRHLRKMGVKIPILALTAHASPEDRQRCFAAGCTNYLTKPINIGQLKNVIRSYS